MTLVPMKRKCEKCKKEYIYNPDVGNIICPFCHGTGIVIGEKKKPSGFLKRKMNER